MGLPLQEKSKNFKVLAQLLDLFHNYEQVIFFFLLSSWDILGKTLNLSWPQFSIYKMWGLEQIISVSCNRKITCPELFLHFFQFPILIWRP